MMTVGEMSSTTLENCIGYTSESNHELTMCFNFHHLKVDYKDGQKWELRQPDHRRMKNLFQTWQEGMQAHGGWNALFWCNHDQPQCGQPVWQRQDLLERNRRDAGHGDSLYARHTLYLSGRGTGQ